jgi:hypothetical protein
MSLLHGEALHEGSGSHVKQTKLLCTRGVSILYIHITLYKSYRACYELLDYLDKLFSS